MTAVNLKNTPWYTQEFYTSYQQDESVRQLFINTLFNQPVLLFSWQNVVASICLPNTEVLNVFSSRIATISTQKGIGYASLETLVKEDRAVELESRLSHINKKNLRLGYELSNVTTIPSMSFEVLLRHFPDRGELLFRKADFSYQNPLYWPVVHNDVDRVQFILDRCPNHLKLLLISGAEKTITCAQKNTYHIYSEYVKSPPTITEQPVKDTLKKNVALAAVCFQAEICSVFLQSLITSFVDDIESYIPYIEEVPFLYDLILGEAPNVITNYFREKGGFSNLSKQQRVSFYRFLTPDEKYTTLSSLTLEDYKGLVTIETLFSLVCMQTMDLDHVHILSATHQFFSAIHPVLLSYYASQHFDLLVAYLPFLDDTRISYCIPLLTKEQLIDLNGRDLPERIHSTVYHSITLTQRASLIQT